jgi:hypothetical protein
MLHLLHACRQRSVDSRGEAILRRRVRASFYAGTVALTALGSARAQTATVTRGTDRLANDTGMVVLTNLPPGEVRLRFRRIGYAPKDTAFTLAANAEQMRLLAIEASP